MRFRLSVGMALSLILGCGQARADVPPKPGMTITEPGKHAIPAGFYRLRTAVKLPGRSPDWDYLAFDQARARLFIARRDAGLWVFDTRRQKLLTRIALTRGAGAALIIQSLNRGFSTNEDGTTTVFRLSDLRAIRRIKFADDADAASYDPVTGRIAFVSADSQSITLIDARSLNIVGRVHLDAKKADASVGDGAGHFLVNERDNDKIAKIDAASGAIIAEWPTTGCSQPTGLAFDQVHQRAFIGCRGKAPVLAVLDAASGAVIQTLALGRGNDGVVFDPDRHRIITTNGIEANIAIFQQEDADHYRLEQAVTTRPNARTIAYDVATRQIFTVTAEGVVNPAAPINSGPSSFYPNAYYDGTFTVLTYAETE